MPEGENTTIEYPSDEVLKERYAQIEETAKTAIHEGKVIGNPILNEIFRGDRWSISTQGFLKGSDTGDFLQQASKVLAAADPGLDLAPPEYLHVSFTEVAFDPTSRQASGLTSADVIKYHDAILANFPQGMPPLRLNLYRLLPTLDPKVEGVEGQTGAVVAGFLTQGDEEMFKIREGINNAVHQAGLKTGSIYGGPPRVIFVTLGRFAEAPVKDGSRIPFLEALDQLNKDMHPGLTTYITQVRIISTTPVEYKTPRGHIEIWPPLALEKRHQLEGPTKFIRPRLRFGRVK